jgi:hypothetical protein
MACISHTIFLIRSLQWHLEIVRERVSSQATAQLLVVSHVYKDSDRLIRIISVKGNEFAPFVKLREMFPSADKVGKLTVFNIGGKRFDSLPQFTTIVKKSTFGLC